MQKVEELVCKIIDVSRKYLLVTSKEALGNVVDSNYQRRRWSEVEQWLRLILELSRMEEIKKGRAISDPAFVFQTEKH